MSTPLQTEAIAMFSAVAIMFAAVIMKFITHATHSPHESDDRRNTRAKGPTSKRTQKRLHPTRNPRAQGKQAPRD
jgi:hypothetical protein